MRGRMPSARQRAHAMRPCTYNVALLDRPCTVGYHTTSKVGFYQCLTEGPEEQPGVPERAKQMRRIPFLLFILLLAAGCSQTVRVAKVADSYEIEVLDDGATAMLNSSILHRDWDEAARKVCPGGYTVIRKEYIEEQPFIPARIVGAVTCR